MSHTVIALKWRPQTFDDLVGQENIAKVLKNSINADRIPHAMIFNGIRGTGKTSAARILAKSLNCNDGPTEKPCNSCENCIEITESRSDDVFEIDGASHTSVDDVRQIIEGIKYHTVKSKFKIYIIDEVHMLSNSAFNALLKTLEEPPPNVIFVLATTELHKIPLTVRSRCLRFTFKKLSVAEIITQLEKILLKEDVQFDSQALGIIAREADGSMRDSQTLLEQLIAFSDGKITLSQTLQLIGSAGHQAYFSCFDSILKNDYQNILKIIAQLDENGTNFSRFINEMAQLARNLIIYKSNPEALFDGGWTKEEIDSFDSLAKDADREQLNSIFGKLVQTCDMLKTSTLPRYTVEVCLLDCAVTEPTVRLSQVISQLEQHVGNNTHKTVSKQNITNDAAQKSSASKKPEQQDSPKIQAFVDFAKQKDPLLGSTLEQCSLSLCNQNLLVKVAQKSFAQSQLSQPDYEQQLNSIFNQFFEKPFTLSVQHDAPNSETTFFQQKEQEKQQELEKKNSKC